MGYEIANFVGAPKKLPPKKVKTTLREDMAKMLFELGRLAIGGIVISEILRRQLSWVDEEKSHDILFIVGIAIGFVSFLLSLILGIREIKSEPTNSRPVRRRKRSKK